MEVADELKGLREK